MARSLVFYLVISVACAVATVYVFRLPPGGIGWVSLVVLVILAALSLWQVWQFGRDLQSPMVETEGPLLRKWQRAELFIAWQSCFILVGRGVFKIAPEEWILLQEKKPVLVRHFPRTMSVVSVETSIST